MRILLHKLPVYFSLIFACLIIYGCSKSEENQTVTEISLINKSSDSIRYYLQGNWRIAKTYGGFSVTTIYYQSNYMSFFPNDSLYWVDKGIILSKAKFSLKKDKTIFGDSTYIIKYLDQTSLTTLELIAIKKRNDTLLLRDNHTEWYTYYLTPR